MILDATKVISVYIKASYNMFLKYYSFFKLKEISWCVLCSHNHGYQPGVIVSKHNSAEEAKQRKNVNNLKQYTYEQIEET
jgi:hypothetical protein